MAEQEPGWYADPTRRHEHRYWDGSAWTDLAADRGITTSDPFDEPAPAVTAPSSAEPHGRGQAWRRFRALRWWWQAVVWLFVPVVPAWMYAGARPTSEMRRKWRIGALVATFAWMAIVAVGGQRDSGTAGASRRTPVQGPTTTRPPAPTSTSRAPRPAEPTTPPTTVPEAERDGDKTNPGAVYPQRTDKQDDDHEALVGGGPSRFGGWSVWVDSASYVRQPGQFSCCDYVKVHVRLLNRDDSRQDWTRGDFSLVRPTGEEYSPSIFVMAPGQLGISGALIHGGQAEGDLYFGIEDLRGTYTIYFEPQFESWASDRGVWQFTL